MIFLNKTLEFVEKLNLFLCPLINADYYGLKKNLYLICVNPRKSADNFIRY